MKTYLLRFLLILSFFGAYNAWAQAPVDCIPEDYEDLEEDDDFKDMENCVLKGADYILGLTLVDIRDMEDDVRDDYIDMGKFIINWTFGTPDYSFALTKSTMGIINKHGYMTSILFACLAKAALDGEKDYMKEGIELFYKYLKNPKNRVKIDGKLKKFIKDYEKGKAYKYTG